MRTGGSTRETNVYTMIQEKTAGKRKLRQQGRSERTSDYDEW
jgi:hypothetical protein